MSAACQFCPSVNFQFGAYSCSGNHLNASGNWSFVKQAAEAACEEHTAGLALFTVRNGLADFWVDGKLHVLSPGTFLLLNPGQRFRISWKNGHETELFALGFGEAQFADALRANAYFAETRGKQPFRFFNRPHTPDATLNQLLELLYQHTTRVSTAIDAEALFHNLLDRLLHLQRQTEQTISKLGPVKPSTRMELYNRLRTGRDYIEANLHRNLSLDEVASEACLSKFHFMRLFKQAFGQTVHQYITAQRLSRTRLLLQLEEKTFPEICRSMGYEDVAWFAKVYKRAFGAPPSRQVPASAFQLSSTRSALAVA